MTIDEQIEALERRVTALEHRAAMETQIDDLRAQVAELTRRLDEWDAAADRARALMAEHANQAPNNAQEPDRARANALAKRAATKADLEAVRRNLRNLRKP